MRRWLLALVLAAGCGGPSGRVPVPDAGRDGAPDVDAASDVGQAETSADTGAGADLRPDGVGNDDAADATGVADATDADEAPDAVEARPDAPPTDGVQMVCPTQMPVLTPSSGAVQGVLQGASNNPAVSCRGGVVTPGPDAFFTLTITQETTIDLLVTSPVSTLIGIRPDGCVDSISELACGEDPPQVDADAGMPPTPTDDAGVPLRQTALRTPLLPGTYTIVIDSFSLGFLDSAPFTLTVGHHAPRANASCAAPVLLTAGSTAAGEPLDLAGAPKPVCGGRTQSSLYYTVAVPAGQRLTARAVPRGISPGWMPRLEVFGSCSSTTCLAQGHLVSGSTQQLDWINNSANWQLIYLAVGADTPVSGAMFDLSVTVVDLFATCDRPMPVKDGTTLPNQDLSLAFPATAATCGGSIDHAFYYSATLLPQQSITVQARPSAGSNNFFLPSVALRQSCDTLSCLAQGSGANFTNNSSADMPVIIEVSTPQPGLVTLFDLTVSMPPPPAGFVVTPTSGLVTTESGGTATFTVALASPPTADVTIGLASDTPTEGTASPTSLSFTPDNWRIPQTVTVTGVDDQVADGPRVYNIVTSPATSTDARYMGLDPDDVEVTNLDNDPGVSVQGANDVVTTESGATATFTVTLNAAPTATVTLGLSSSDVSEGTVSPAQLTFTPANWNVPQTVTVTGVDDAIVDGTQAYTIIMGTLVSTDARYGGQKPPDIPALNLDDDQVPVGVKVVSADHSCGNAGLTVPIAVDRANQLYIVMQCENGLWLTTSTDGGVTFTDPALIPGTDNFSQVAELVGGAPGFAYLVFGGNDGNVYFLRTADAGATWSTRLALSPREDFMHLAAAEKIVVVSTPGIGQSKDQTVISRSVDGGRSFFQKTVVSGVTMDVVLEPDAVTAWMLQGNNGTTELQKSLDAGVTFTKVGQIDQDVSSHVIGRDHLFSISGPLQIISLADPTMIDTSIGFINQPVFSMAVDDIDSVAMLDSDPNGHLRATRVVLGATEPTDGRSLGPSPSSAGIVTLSRKAAGVGILNGNLVLYTTVVW
jgi:hypothetical protein